MAEPRGVVSDREERRAAGGGGKVSGKTRGWQAKAPAPLSVTIRFPSAEVGEAGSFRCFTQESPVHGRALQSKRKGGSSYDPSAGKSRPSLGWTNHGTAGAGGRSPVPATSIIYRLAHRASRFSCRISCQPPGRCEPDILKFHSPSEGEKHLA